MRFMVMGWLLGLFSYAVAGIASRAAPHRVEHQHGADEIDGDEERLRQQPRVLSRRDRRVIEARPDGIEYEVARIADGEHAEQADDAQPQGKGAGSVPTIARCKARGADLCQAERHHAQSAGLHGGDRQRPRAGVPERDVLEELLPGRPARATAIVGDDAEHEEHAEDEEAEAPFDKSCTEHHRASP
jgi:hypothetical protein